MRDMGACSACTGTENTFYRVSEYCKDIVETSEET
jgi:hypothetical protein